MQRQQLLTLGKSGALSQADKKKHRQVIRFLERTIKELNTQNILKAEEAFLKVKTGFDNEVVTMKAENVRIKERRHALFGFLEQAFGEGNEMLILVTELTVNTYSARFISTFGCEDYQKHNEKLRLSERQEDLMREIEALKL